MTITLLLLSLTVVVAFQSPGPSSREFAYRAGSITTSKLALTTNSPSVTIRASDLDDALGLTPEERAVVNVHRVCSKSVVYVTSVLKPMGRSERSNRRGTIGKENDEVQKKQQSLPRGTALGSGSGFVVDPAGYVVTNYHVIQRAYESNQIIIQCDSFWKGVVANTTNKIQASGGDSAMLSNIQGIINGTINAISGRLNSDNLPAKVFVRFGTDDNGGGGYIPCDIVDVVKELDVAVLKICDSSSTSLPALTYGSSSDLLVGQSLLAIGNPFGLDRTITAGLVSALGRSVTGVAGNDIKNCIQTDAAINPGNSGGPLLTLNGKVVGVNTMIITTSGSSAGIGFAVPGDNVKESTDRIVKLDKERQLRLTTRKGRGWIGVDVAMNYLEDSFCKHLVNVDETGLGAFITAIDVNSPLLHTQDTNDVIKITSVVNGSVVIGDRIIKVGGTDIANGKDFANEMKNRGEGEQITLTVVNEDNDARIIYIKLGRIPL